jgi:hypothetical protein
MKKPIYIIPLLLIVISCSKKIEPKELISSWKMRDVVDQTGQIANEKTTFYNDSLVFEMFANKKLVERISTKYKFDTLSNIIHYQIENINVDFKVLKLTDSEMELQNVLEKKPIRFIKIKIE